MVKTSNFHKLTFFNFYENAAFLKALEAFLFKVYFMLVPIQKRNLIIHSRKIIGIK